MVKKSKKFNYQKDLKKKWKQMKEKKNPKVDSDQLKPFWDRNKSIKQNYINMGISIDPNQSLAIPKVKTLMNPEAMEIEKAKELNKVHKEEPAALKKLLHDASLPEDKSYNLNENDILYCIYMMEKYGEDYGKMAKDYKNYYQDTPLQIKKRINLFKKMKTRYEKYLSDKKAGVNFLDILDEKF